METNEFCIQQLWHSVRKRCCALEKPSDTALISEKLVGRLTYVAGWIRERFLHRFLLQLLDVLLRPSFSSFQRPFAALDSFLVLCNEKASFLESVMILSSFTINSPSVHFSI